MGAVAVELFDFHEVVMNKIVDLGLVSIIQQPTQAFFRATNEAGALRAFNLLFTHR